jgi:hypothetical protein
MPDLWARPGRLIDHENRNLSFGRIGNPLLTVPEAMSSHSLTQQKNKIGAWGTGSIFVPTVLRLA